MKRSLRNKTKTKRRHRKGKKGLFSSKRKMVGGNINPPSFQPLGASNEQYYYKLNDHMMDPADPGMIMSSRNYPSLIGGKGKKRRTRRKRVKMIGGHAMLPGSMNNPVTNFGNYDMPQSALSLISGTVVPSTDVFDQPSYYTYNENRIPLV
jgi:hypothetical protein